MTKKKNLRIVTAVDVLKALKAAPKTAAANQKALSAEPTDKDNPFIKAKVNLALMRKEIREKLDKLGVPKLSSASIDSEEYNRSVVGICTAINKIIASTMDYTFDENLKPDAMINLSSDEIGPEVWVAKWREFLDKALKVKRGKVKDDCLEENERIYVETESGYELRPIKDVEVGDRVLSYDFETQKYCSKSVLNKIDKGKLEVFDVRLSNHQKIRVSEGHNFWSKRVRQEDGYIKRKKDEITSDHHFLTPYTRRLHYVPIEDYLDEQLWYVVGHFLAEGYIIKGKVCSSGHQLDTHIIPILEDFNIPYSRHVNNSKCPYITFLESDFKNFLKTLLKNSFNIYMDPYINLERSKLKAIMDGYWLGDGHMHRSDKVYSTSCPEFAQWLYQASLRLGDPLYIYKQENHGGVGDKPIYRVHGNPNSPLKKEYGFKGLGQVRIKEWVPVEKKARCYDITVEGTSTYIHESGLVCHNCDGYAAIGLILAWAAGIPGYRLAFGIVISETALVENKNRKPAHKLNFDHAVGIYWAYDKWYLLGDTWDQDRNTFTDTVNSRHLLYMYAPFEKGFKFTYSDEFKNIAPLGKAPKAAAITARPLPGEAVEKYNRSKLLIG